MKASLEGRRDITFSGTKILWSANGEGKRAEYKCRVWNSAEGQVREEYGRRDGDIVRIVLNRECGKVMWQKSDGAWRTLCDECHCKEQSIDVEMVSRNYELSRGDTYYLERPCISVRAESRLAGRPVLEAIVDTTTCVPLSVEVAMPGGNEGYGYRFENISFEKFDESIFEPPAECKVLASKEGSCQARSLERIEDAKEKLGFEVLAPGKMPEGFSVSSTCFGCCRMEGQAGGGLTVRLSDGLSLISIYEWDGSGEAPEAREPDFTEVKRDGKSVFWRGRQPNIMLTTSAAGTKVAIFGEIPLEELLDLAFSLEPVT